MLEIYRASAGSGKTHSLAGQYLKLLLGTKDKESGSYRLALNCRNRHRNILAITFTNKATEEMKRRIVHELAVLAGRETGWSKPSDYAESLIVLFDCTFEALQKQASLALSDILLDFGGFRVSTIDSFFQTILRAFAREAELVGNYNIELDIEGVLNLACGMVLSSLNTNPNSTESRQLENWLLQTVKSRIDAGQSFNIFNRSSQLFSTLVDFAKKTTDPVYVENRPELIEYLSDFLKISAFGDALVKCESKLLDPVVDAATKLITGSASMGTDLYDVFPKTVVDLVFKFADYRTARIENVKSDNKSYPKLAAADESLLKKNKICPAQIFSLCQNFGFAYKKCIEHNTLIQQLKNSVGNLGLIRSIEKALKELLLNDNSLLLDDTPVILGDIVDGDSTPFVFERVGNVLEHFLIDEFQDTSISQWNVLKTLVFNSVAENNDSLIIGDEKQSIYRFRNADPSILEHKVEDEMRQWVSVRPLVQKSNTNWRSAPQIVEFNNSIFKQLSLNLGYDNIYANVEQAIATKNSGLDGFVKISKSENSEELLIQEIYRQLDAGYRPCDIAILVRSNFDTSLLTEAVAVANNAENSPHKLQLVSPDIVSVNDSHIVRLIVNALRNMELQTANTESSDTKRYRMMVDEFHKSIGKEADQSELLTEIVAKDANSQQENINTDTNPFDNIVSTVELLISRYIHDEALQEHNPFITAFLDAVVDFQQRNGNSLSRFLEWWDATGHKANVNLPSNPDAISIMTIHKAKGLQFPCVHIYKFNQEFLKSSGSISSYKWFSLKNLECDLPINPEIIPPVYPLLPQKYMVNTSLMKQYLDLKNLAVLDEINLAYVAFTRAERELAVYIPYKPVKTPTKNSTTSYIDAAERKINYTRVNQPFEEVFAKDLSCETNSEFEMVYGIPTTPVRQEEKPHKFLDPVETVAIPPFISRGNTDIWENTKLEDDMEHLCISGNSISIRKLLASGKTLDDIEKRLKDIIRSGVMSANDAGQIYDYISSAIYSARLQKFFDRQADIMLNMPLAKPYEGELDRVIWHKDGSGNGLIIRQSADNTERDRIFANRLSNHISRLIGHRFTVEHLYI